MPLPPRFDPIIETVTRRAENIYTKMAIRRDESQDLGRRKKDDGQNRSSSLPWEDTTDVSILALRGFLEDLLGLSHQSLQHNTDHLPLPVTTTEQPLSPQTAASHAAQAYRTMGRVVHDENVDKLNPILPAAPLVTENAVILGDGFGEAERKKMEGYLEDLVDLEQRGIEFLTLRRSLTFLESIEDAINSVK
jgi:hypothetical protein